MCESKSKEEVARLPFLAKLCYNKFCENYQNWMGLNDIYIRHMVHFQDPFLMSNQDLKSEFQYIICIMVLYSDFCEIMV
jgi:hypothetical protein